MASVASRSSRASSHRDKKLHEGWVEHYSYNYREWNRFFMALDDKALRLYYLDRSGQRMLAGTINLGCDSRIREASGPYSFELITFSVSGIQQRDHFQFRNENDRDVWKAFIIGLSTGIVPDDVNLLPGQLRDVLEAVHDACPPPPLPSRPSEETTTAVVHHHYSEPVDPEATSNTTEERVADSGPSEDRAASQLMRRKSDLNFKILETKSPRPVLTSRREPLLSSHVVPHPAMPHPSVVHQQVVHQSHLSPPNMIHCPVVHQSPLSPPPNLSPSPVFHPSVSNPPVAQASVRWPAFVSNRTRSLSSLGQCGFSSRSSRPGLERLIQQSSAKHLNNNEFHPFYLEPERNKTPPTWFVECSRQDAEAILTLGRQCGNVLMRPSSVTSVTGKYVITMRADQVGGSRLHHFAVIRGDNGFRIDVDNEQSPMYCLSDVMEFFLATVGPSARALRVRPHSSLSAVATSPGFTASAFHAGAARSISNPFGFPDLDTLTIEDTDNAATTAVTTSNALSENPIRVVGVQQHQEQVQDDNDALLSMQDTLLSPERQPLNSHSPTSFRSPF